jgi:hypothetical protein
MKHVNATIQKEISREQLRKMQACPGHNPGSIGNLCDDCRKALEIGRRKGEECLAYSLTCPKKVNTGTKAMGTVGICPCAAFQRKEKKDG